MPELTNTLAAVEETDFQTVIEALYVEGIRMKKKIALLVLGLVAVTYASTMVVPVDTENTRVDPGQVHTARNTWVVLDTTTSSGTEPTDLAVGERTYQLVKTAIAVASSGEYEISVYDIPRDWNAARFRAIGVTENATVTYQIYFGTLGDGNLDSDSTTADCELAYAGQLAFVIGTQASTTTDYEMADAVTVTSSDWVAAWSSKTPGSDRCAEASIDLSGADVMVVLASTATANCKLLAKGY
jgi:hypothetical protein